MVDKIYEMISAGTPISPLFNPEAKICFRDDSREPEELTPEELDNRLRQKIRTGSKACIGALCCSPVEQGHLVSVTGQYTESGVNFQDAYVMHAEEKFIYIVAAHFLLFPAV